MADRNTGADTWAAEMAALFQQVQQETLLLALPALGLAGLWLGLAPGSRDPLRGILGGLALFLLAPFAWLVRRWSFAAASWLLVAGWLAVELAMLSWAGLAPAACLLALPAGLATLLVGLPAGIAVAGGVTAVLLLAPAGQLAADAGLRTAAALLAGGTVGLIWLATRPLLTAGRWAWSSYERSQALLEEAGDYQLRLQQTLEDLTSANRQLVLLNQVAEGLRQAAEDARRAKEQFVANVSHELRTPLNMIIGFTEMIVRAPQTYGERLPPALLADLNVTLRNSQHLAELINDVLDLSQIEAGQMALTRARGAARDRRLCHPGGAPPVRVQGPVSEGRAGGRPARGAGDPTRIREVLLNLLSNAGRFTERGGVLRVTCAGEAVLASVADTGPGIAEADIERLFQPFQQLDSSTRRQHGGSGLGLSISKSFVELHGGRMWLESTLGAGTTVYFTLPLDPAAPDPGSALRWLNPDWVFRARTRRSLAPVSGVRRRLIVCETAGTLSRLLTRYLDNTEIVSVPDLAAARLELSQAPAQALLWNAAATGEALAELGDRQLPYGTPAIVCSVAGVPEAARRLGIADYLVKPIARETLLATLERLGLAGKTILVADDEEDARHLFWRILSSAGCGYRVLTAGDGQEAWQSCRNSARMRSCSTW